MFSSSSRWRRRTFILAGVIGVAALALPGPAGAFTQRVSVGDGGQQGYGVSYGSSISADGRYVAFDSVSNNVVPGEGGERDVFVRDRVAGTTTLVSQTSGGRPADADSWGPSISADGRRVAFASSAADLAEGRRRHASGRVRS